MFTNSTDVSALFLMLIFFMPFHYKPERRLENISYPAYFDQYIQQHPLLLFIKKYMYSYIYNKLKFFLTIIF